MQVGVKLTHQLAPELPSEARVPVRRDASRKSVDADDALEELRSYLRRSSRAQWHEHRHLAEAVYDSHHRRVAVILRKLRDEVDVDLLPGTCRSGKRLVQALRPCRVGLRALTHFALPAVASYRFRHPWPVEMLPYHLLGALLAKVSP